VLYDDAAALARTKRTAHGSTGNGDADQLVGNRIEERLAEGYRECHAHEGHAPHFTTRRAGTRPRRRPISAGHGSPRTEMGSGGLFDILPVGLSEDRVDALDQLARRERLGDVIVGADFEARFLV